MSAVATAVATAHAFMLLAVFGRERTPQLAAPEDWKWTRAWASRWWLVECQDGSLDTARAIIASVDSAGADRSLLESLGRVIDCGRNGRGGPDRSGVPSSVARSRGRR